MRTRSLSESSTRSMGKFRFIKARLKWTDGSGRFPPGRPLKPCGTGQLKPKALELEQTSQPCRVAAEPPDNCMSLRVYQSKLPSILASKSHHHANINRS